MFLYIEHVARRVLFSNFFNFIFYIIYIILILFIFSKLFLPQGNVLRFSDLTGSALLIEFCYC